MMYLTSESLHVQLHYQLKQSDTLKSHHCYKGLTFCLSLRVYSIERLQFIRISSSCRFYNGRISLTFML